MNSVEESLVSRTAIDALLEESDSKIDETIRGLKDFLVNIDGAVRKLLPLAVSLLGTDNEALLIPANILPGHNALNTKILFRSCYKADGKKLISNYLTSIQESVNQIRQDLASKKAMFEDARSFLMRYRQVVTSSRVIREMNNSYGHDNKNFAVDDGLIYEENLLNPARNAKNSNPEMTHEYEEFRIPTFPSNTDPLIDESCENTDEIMTTSKNDNIDSHSKELNGLPKIDENSSSCTDNKTASSSTVSDILFSSSKRSFEETNSLAPKSNVRNIKVRETDLDHRDPSHYESFRALMSKRKIKNSNAKKEFKLWLLQQIHEMVGNDLTGRTEEILKVDNYHIRLKEHYDLSFENFCKVYARSFSVGFRYSSEDWSSMVAEASRKNASKRARFSQKEQYQHYDIK